MYEWLETLIFKSDPGRKIKPLIVDILTNVLYLCREILPSSLELALAGLQPLA
jgi:hypothetical protein